MKVSIIVSMHKDRWEKFRSVQRAVADIIIYALRKYIYNNIAPDRASLGKWFSHFPKIAGVLYFMIVIYGQTFITNSCDVSIRFLLPSNYLMEVRLFCDKYRYDVICKFLRL